MTPRPVPSRRACAPGSRRRACRWTEFVADLQARAASRELWPMARRRQHGGAIRSRPRYESAASRCGRCAASASWRSSRPTRRASPSSTSRRSGSGASPTSDGGVDLELGGFELSFRRGRAGNARGHPDRLQGRHGRRGRRVGPGARRAAASPWRRRRRATDGRARRSFRLADPDGRQVAVFYDFPG